MAILTELGNDGTCGMAILTDFLQSTRQALVDLMRKHQDKYSDLLTQTTKMTWPDILHNASKADGMTSTFEFHVILSEHEANVLCLQDDHRVFRLGAENGTCLGVI